VSTRTPSPLNRKLSWLLWLALLLPIAQSAAAWHGYSHVVKASAQGDDWTAAQLDHCDRCLAGAALSAGALPSAPHSLGVSTPSQVPLPVAVGVWSARTALAYRSRAPPSTLRFR